MPHPKRRWSHARTRRRRQRYRVRAVAWAPCPSCRRPKPPHQICPHCGFYRGQAMVQIQPKGKEKKKEE